MPTPHHFRRLGFFIRALTDDQLPGQWRTQTQLVLVCPLREVFDLGVPPFSSLFSSLFFSLSSIFPLRCNTHNEAEHDIEGPPTPQGKTQLHSTRGRSHVHRAKVWLKRGGRNARLFEESRRCPEQEATRRQRPPRNTHSSRRKANHQAANQTWKQRQLDDAN